MRASTPKKTETLIKTKSNFGEFVDYYLFALKSPKTFTQIAVSLGEMCNCTFTLMNDFISPNDPMQARFKMAYSQFGSPHATFNCFDTDIEKVNVVLFQNRTTNFDVSKGPSELADTAGMFPFFNEGLTCYALNSSGLCINHAKGFNDFDYFVFIYAKKDRDAEKFFSFFKELNLMLKVDLTSFLYKKNVASSFFQSICYYSDKQIAGHSKSRLRFFLGSLPKPTTNLPGTLVVSTRYNY